MGQIGIIAEYNPFHNGHQYQIQCIQQAFPQKEIAVILSGNYVQRGEPAIFNKYIRTNMALSGGADCVLELPSIYSCSSAEYFAAASILTLAATGAIDTICFGCECEEPSVLFEIASILKKEPSSYCQLLKEQLANGYSFPKARSLALSSYMNNDDIANILSLPNNILAIEYLKTILRYELPITPYMIQRTNNYHEHNLPSVKDSSSFGIICSATALREELKKENSYDCLKPYLPENVLSALYQASYNRPLFATDFYPFIQHSLLKDGEYLTNFMDISPDLANRINKYDVFPDNMEEFIHGIANKTITQTRISRSLFHLLLMHQKKDYQNFQQTPEIPYCRILGFRKASHLPKQIKDTSTIPVLTKVANYKKILNPDHFSFFDNQIFADNCYRQVYYNKYGVLPPSEFEHSVIIYEK